jgi:SAM-dependent methyltransferase
MNKTVKQTLIRLYDISKLFGFDPIALVNGVRGLGFYFRDYYRLKKQKGNDTVFPFAGVYPVLAERFSESGNMSGHYFHQDLYVARRVFANNPIRHIDIGSRIDGFVAHVASFRKIEIIDIRDQPGKISNIIFRKADLMQLPADLVNACDSISSLHAIEHFGLGRYSDPIDYYGYAKALDNITSILQPGGIFYFSVPIGKQRIEFNAHRIFSVRFLLDYFNKNYTTERFSYVDDSDNFFENAVLTPEEVDRDFGCRFGCGIFELRKK